VEPIVSTGALWVVARDGPSGGGGGGLVNHARGFPDRSRVDHCDLPQTASFTHHDRFPWAYRISDQSFSRPLGRSRTGALDIVRLGARI